MHKFAGLIKVAGFPPPPTTMNQPNQSLLTNYAKRTQFAERPNKRNPSINKGLRKLSTSKPRQNEPKRTQTNPIRTQFAKTPKWNITLFITKPYEANRL